MKNRMALLVAMLIAAPALAAQPQILRLNHVVVTYSGITEPQARSLARVADAARAAAVARYGFDVPETINVNVDCRLGNDVRLFTDGHDTYTLNIRTGFDLAPPAACGIYNLYGMCHELGHVVMYRVLTERRWLRGGAAEAWAHYFGSQIVDDVYAAEGQQAWWMPYDYRADGMERLRAQLAGSDADHDDVRTAAAWMELASLVGERNLPALFAAWEKAKADPADPSPALLAAIKQVSANPKIDGWWKTAAPLLTVARPRSTFVPGRTTAPAAAAAPAAPPATKPGDAGKPSELATDDGKSAGKRSIAGTGHAVAFEAPADGSQLVAVKIFGSRYGAQQPPAEDFHVYLCDADGAQIKDFAFPYKTFLRGGDRWVTLKLPAPAEVPKNFVLCVAFNPTQTKGVYVHYDKSVDGDSRTGLPGNLNDAFDKGDWMIRAVVTPR